MGKIKTVLICFIRTVTTLSVKCPDRLDLKHTYSHQSPSPKDLAFKIWKTTATTPTIHEEIKDLDLVQLPHVFNLYIHIHHHSIHHHSIHQHSIHIHHHLHHLTFSISKKWLLAVICVLSLFFPVAHSKTLKRDVKALNEIKASLGWRVVYSWVGDDPCGDGDLPPWSGVTCSIQGDYRVVAELEVYAFDRWTLYGGDLHSHNRWSSGDRRSCWMLLSDSPWSSVCSIEAEPTTRLSFGDGFFFSFSSGFYSSDEDDRHVQSDLSSTAYELNISYCLLL
ncbi:hypothetical protein Rs2_21065 [Raphanus sativus]|nr:hypothetical protein Rs2_21065 [Raphanus sativus]